MNRRAFLVIGGGIAAAAVGSLAVARRLRVERVADLNRFEWFGLRPATRLRYRYRWLDVDPAAFDSYVADYERSFGRLDRFSIPHPSFFTRFLLSTNFFSTRPRNGKPVAYTTFYAPGLTPCYNPLAQPPLSDAELASRHGTLDQYLMASGRRAEL